MQDSERDLLFDIFEAHLLNTVVEDGSVEQFITRVADDYLLRLMRSGHVPVCTVRSLRDDVLLEVRDMFRMQTYGFHDLKEYRHSTQFRKLKNRRSS